MIHPQPTSVLLLLFEERTRVPRVYDSEPAIAAPRRSRRAAALRRLGRDLILRGSRLLGGRPVRGSRALITRSIRALDSAPLQCEKTTADLGRRPRGDHPEARHRPRPRFVRPRFVRGRAQP